MTMQASTRLARALPPFLCALCLAMTASVASADEGQAQIDAALRWLAQSQAADGSWEDAQADSDGRTAKQRTQQADTVGCTGIALLALLGDGNTLTQGPHKRVVAAGVDWLLAQQNAETGLIGKHEGHAFLYNHGIATQALAKLLLITKGDQLRTRCQLAVNYIHRARNPYGVWRYSVPPTGDNDTSVTSWMVHALVSARAAGLQVDEQAFAAATNWLDEVTDQQTGRTGYDSIGAPSARIAGVNEHFPSDSGEAMTAAGLSCRAAMGASIASDPLARKGADLLLRKLPEWNVDARTIDMYYWYFGGRSMRAMDGHWWKTWKLAIIPALTRSQLSEGADRGSWDASGVWGMRGGRVYATALMALCLEEARLAGHAPSSTEPQFITPSPFNDVAFKDVIGIGGGSGDRYGGRFGKQRSKLATSGGKSIEQNVKAGLDWLAQHQAKDGSWDSDAFMSNSAAACKECADGGDPLMDVGLTGLALLAFLGDGHTIKRGDYQSVVLNGVQWLRTQQDPDTGLIGDEVGHSFMYRHAIATLAMTEAYYFGRSPLIKRNCQKAVNYIIRARNPYGAWRYDSPPVGDNDTSVTGWMVLALITAREAGLKIDNEALVGAIDWIDEVSDHDTGRVGYNSVGSRSSRVVGVNDNFPAENGEAMTAIGLLCRFMESQDPAQVPIMQKHADLIVKTLPDWTEGEQGGDMYYWYYGSYAMYQMGGKHWAAWRRAMSRAVMDSQRNDGHFRGSWDPNGPWGATGGRIYSTAMMLLCLESTYRYAR